MSTERDDDGRPWRDEQPRPLLVGDDGASARPFMPGILVHSLVQRGVPFAEAYTVAREVGRGFAGRDRVAKEDIGASVRERLGRDPYASGYAVSPDILVSQAGDGLPFSKGLLSQSLLATAIDPAEATAVARDIEAELIASGVREIGRPALRDLAQRTLRRRAGDEAADSYLLWRSHQEPERPVVILMGGTSGVGKTSLALEVARRLGIGRVQSTDSIRQMMRILLLPELVPAIHASSYDAHLHLPHEEAEPPSVLDGFRAQAAAVSVGVRTFLDRTVAESANLVIDGVSILPGLIDPEAYADRAEIVTLLVAALDEESLRSRFVARGTGQKRRAPHRYLENLDAIVAIQRQLIRLAGEHGVPIIDNVSFDESVRQVIDHVMRRLRQAQRSPSSRPGSAAVPRD